MLKELLALAKEIKEEKKYRAQLITENTSIDALDYFVQKTRATGVTITVEFNDGKRIRIEPYTGQKVESKTFAEKYMEAHKNAV